jgi:hypothetical protein
MKYVKTFESFKNSKNDSVNEEFLGDIFNAAKGALKNFIGGLMAPFKSLKDDFKKGLKFEQVKTKFVGAIDSILKASTDNINKAKDEGEINQMVDAFRKQIDEKMAEFDKEIKTVKESKIYEGVVQDALIGGRVLFGILKDEIVRLKEDFDKKFAAAKDLSAKKQVRIDEIKAIVDGFKKKINDEKLIKDNTDKYKTENKIQGGGPAGDEATLFKSYGVEKKEDLVGKEVRYKTKSYDANKKPEEQPDNIGKLKVLKITPDGLFLDGEKEDFEKKMTEILPGENTQENPEEKIKNELGKIKTETEKMKKVGEILPKIIAKVDDEEAMKKVTDALV